MKRLLLGAGIERRFDRKSVRSFKLRHSVPGSSTLIRNVYKLPLQKVLKISEDGVSFEEHRYKPAEDIISSGMNSEACETAWIEACRKSIQNCANTHSANMSLSSGYDSNFILWNLTESKTREINCFTVGGAKGANEISAAHDIAMYYGAVNCKSATVTPNTFQSLPDIIWRLEGLQYSQGVFLQYELARVLKENNIKTMICGDGSDEIFTEAFGVGINNPSKKHPVFVRPHGDTYVRLSQYVIRKSAILMNSFEIVPRYPYTDKEVISLAQSARVISGKLGKKFHTDICKKCFPDNVMEKIKTSGGITDISALFEEDAYKSLKAFSKEYALRSGVLVSLYDAVCMCIASLTGVVKGQKINMQKMKRQRFYVNTMVQLYLKIFLELFISGKYDEDFAEQACDIPLNALLNNIKVKQ